MRRRCIPFPFPAMPALVLGLSFISFKPLEILAKTPKDTLVIGWEQVPRTFDPRYAVDAESQYLEDLMHCALIGYQPDGTMIGELAKTWKWVNDKTLELELNTSARFGDGSLVTADDVKATYDFFLKKDPKQVSPRAGAFKFIKEITASKNKVTFHLTQADATFVTNLIVGILPTKLAQSEMFESNTKIQGCGPFTLESVSLAGLKLKANQSFSLGEKAKTPFIEIKVIKDENTRLSKLRNGELDICQNNISLNSIETVKNNYKTLKVITLPALKTSYIGFNFQDNILKNIKVRQAISLAVNRQDIIQYLLKGMATPANTMLPPNNSFYNNSLPSSAYDPEKAKKLLDEAGYPLAKGQRFSLSYKTTNNETRIGIARTIASDLAKVGIKVHVQPLEWGRFKEDIEKGHVQLWGLNWIGFKDPDIYRYAFATESFAPHGGNRGRFSHPELDTLLEHARLSTDEEIRKKDYFKIQELIYEQAPYAFLFHEDNYAVIQDNIENFQLYVDGRYSSLKETYKK